jgi:hypothetical protein
MLRDEWLAWREVLHEELDGDTILRRPPAMPDMIGRAAQWLIVWSPISQRGGTGVRRQAVRESLEVCGDSPAIMWRLLNRSSRRANECAVGRCPTEIRQLPNGGWARCCLPTSRTMRA